MKEIREILKQLYDTGYKDGQAFRVPLDGVVFKFDAEAQIKALIKQAVGELFLELSSLIRFEGKKLKSEPDKLCDKFIESQLKDGE